MQKANELPEGGLEAIRTTKHLALEGGTVRETERHASAQGEPNGSTDLQGEYRLIGKRRSVWRIWLLKWVRLMRSPEIVVIGWTSLVVGGTILHRYWS